MYFCNRADWRISSGVLAGVICVFLLIVSLASESRGQQDQQNDAGGNAQCYVCHSGLKTEDIAADHLAMDITCDECHGTSTEHMHDEMLMTEPDLLFGRAEVQKMCSDPSCHQPGEGRLVYGRQDHKDTEKVEAFFEKWRGRTRPNGRAVSTESVCTDCHGTHNLNKAVTDTSEQQWAAIFNGQNLDGWKAAGKASWTIRSGRIAAKQIADGDGTLWSEKKYADYEMAVTFRAEWPVHAGVWVRSDGANQGPRIEIFDEIKTGAQTGSVLWPGRGLVLVSLDEELTDKESWNTISVKSQGNRVAVWLNGEQIGSVRAVGPAEGHVGFYLAPADSGEAGELTIREVMMKELVVEE